jgi:hypothetical protein
VSAAKSKYVHSTRVLERIATLSPFATPISINPRERSRTISPTSVYVFDAQVPESSLKRTASTFEWSAIATGSRSAIVFASV